MKIFATALVASLAFATSALADDPNLRESTHQTPAMEMMQDGGKQAAGVGNASYFDPTANRYGDGAPYVMN